MKRLATPCPPIAGTLYLILLVDSELIIPIINFVNKGKMIDELIITAR